MCLLAIYIFFLEKFLFRSFAYFLIRLFGVFFVVECTFQIVLLQPTIKNVLHCNLEHTWILKRKFSKEYFNLGTCSGIYDQVNFI